MSGWEAWGARLSLIIPVLMAESAAASGAQPVCAVFHFQSVLLHLQAWLVPFYWGGTGKSVWSRHFHDHKHCNNTD